MGNRGGTYKLYALDIKTFRKDTAKWVASGSEIGQACKNTDDLHFWYRKNWPNTKVFEIGEWEMQENKRKRETNGYLVFRFTLSVWKNLGAFFAPERRKNAEI